MAATSMKGVTSKSQHISSHNQNEISFSSFRAPRHLYVAIGSTLPISKHRGKPCVNPRKTTPWWAWKLFFNRREAQELAMITSHHFPLAYTLATHTHTHYNFILRLHIRAVVSPWTHKDTPSITHSNPHSNAWLHQAPMEASSLSTHFYTHLQSIDWGLSNSIRAWASYE